MDLTSLRALGSWGFISPLCGSVGSSLLTDSVLIPDDQIQPPSRDDLPDADPTLVRRDRASPYPPTASDRVQKSVDATV